MGDDPQKHEAYVCTLRLCLLLVSTSIILCWFQCPLDPIHSWLLSVLYAGIFSCTIFYRAKKNRQTALTGNGFLASAWLKRLPTFRQNTWLCLNIGGITKRDQKGKCGARTDVLGCARLCYVVAVVLGCASSTCVS